MQEPLGEQEEGGGAGDGDGGAGMESDGELDHCTDDEVMNSNAFLPYIKSIMFPTYFRRRSMWTRRRRR